MSVARGMIEFHGADQEDVSLVYYHSEGSPMWVIPDLNRAVRRAHLPAADCFGEPWKPIDRLIYARYMASALIAEDPASYAPITEEAGDLDYLYIVTHARQRNAGELPWDVKVLDGAGKIVHYNQRVENLAKHYPDLGKRYLRAEEWGLETVGDRYTRHYRGFLTKDEAIRAGVLRHKTRGDGAFVYAIDAHRDTIQTVRKLKRPAVAKK